MATRTATRVPATPSLKLAATWHLPDPTHRAPHGVAVVAPGVAVPARVMAPLADALADAGWETMSFDYAGIGASAGGVAGAPPTALAADRLRDWGGRDLDIVLRIAHHRADGRPLVLVGHSAGAWLTAFTEMAGHLDAVVGLASMSGYWRDLKRAEHARMLFFHRVAVPVLTRALGVLPGRPLGLGEDLPAGVAREWARWISLPDFFLGDPTVTDELHLDAFTAPVRVYRPTDDVWATPRSIDRLWSRFPSLRFDHVEVDPVEYGGDAIGHLGLMRPQLRDSLWQDLAAWLGDVTGAGSGRTVGSVAWSSA